MKNSCDTAKLVETFQVQMAKDMTSNQYKVKNEMNALKLKIEQTNQEHAVSMQRDIKKGIEEDTEIKLHQIKEWAKKKMNTSH